MWHAAEKHSITLPEDPFDLFKVFGFRFLVWIPSFFIASGRGTLKSNMNFLLIRYFYSHSIIIVIIVIMITIIIIDYYTIDYRCWCWWDLKNKIFHKPSFVSLNWLTEWNRNFKAQKHSSSCYAIDFFNTKMHTCNIGGYNLARLPRVISCKVRKRYTLVPPRRSCATKWWCWSGSWHRRARSALMMTVNEITQNYTKCPYNPLTSN